jgi:hypothetical protein
MLQSALLGGLFIGVLSSLPILSLGNTCCCLWVVTGGLLTTYLQQQGRETRVESGEAAMGGLLAGVVGALLMTLVSFVLVSVSGQAVDEQLRQVLSSINLPADLRDRLDSSLTGRSVVLINAAVSVPAYAVFGMLGGLLGLTVFKKKPKTQGGNWA